MLAGDAASRSLGIALEHVGPGTAEVSMTVRPDMTNGWDLCHGGLIAALADTAFAVACNSYGEVTVAAGFDITFLEPARSGDRLRAQAVERARRGRSGLYDVTVVRIADQGDEVVIAEFRGRSRSLGRPIAEQRP
ncbi:hydroxyphenylacetyl-CoA thioesterase PaaI [Actinoplanes italicus]|nr:hydroxyphenylacetyl-CoA thioesterase PaaI [Actinoplanes italicus]